VADQLGIITHIFEASGGKLISKSKSIACDVTDILNLVMYPTDELPPRALESIKASVLNSQSCTQPSQGIVHLLVESMKAKPSKHPKGLVEVVQGVLEAFNTIQQG